MGTDSTTKRTLPHDVEFDAQKGVVFEKTKSSKYMPDKELSERNLFDIIN